MPLSPAVLDQHSTLQRRRLMTLVGACAMALLSCMSGAATAPSPAKNAPTGTAVVRAFEDARRQGPLALRAFLYGMPKGADLHMHLSGAIYAETFIRNAGEDGLCVDPNEHAFVKPLPSSNGNHAVACPSGDVLAASAPDDQHLYDALIDAFSMRAFEPRTGDSGHDHFFDTFDKFGGTSKTHKGEWLDEVAARAAAQNEQYLEIMDTPDFKAAAALAAKIGFNADFAQYREALLAGGLRDSIPTIRATLDSAEAARKQIEHCGQPDARPACTVKIRCLFQILRSQPRESIFAQSLLAMELAAADPRFVGLNFVQPEDGYVSMRDYRLQMQMLDSLHRFYPKMHISLHAGELAPGMVPPDGLTFHIRAAVDLGHAERIGHGVDVMYEDHPYDLLRQMATHHVMVEINLTSNDVILGIAGLDHPFPLYRRYGVPMALSTDDEGVSRIDLTNEFVRAAVTYGLGYDDLKHLARTSIEHSFLPGDSLWEASTPESLDRPVGPCKLHLGAEQPAEACAVLLHHSEKAAEEWELERRFHAFEAGFSTRIHNGDATRP
jgi:adenosine deaminase